MDFSKLKNKLLICLCIVVIILPFYLITFCYADDTIPGIVLNGVGSTGSVGDIVTLSLVDAAKGIYFPVRAGFSYNLNFNLINTQVYRIFISDDVPALDTEGLMLYRDNFTTNTYTFTATQDGYLFFWNYNIDLTNDNTTFQLVGDVMNSSVSSLVDNVGISSIWNIFDISINYIVVVVLFAFGCYIIFRIIRKITRGKEGL